MSKAQEKRDMHIAYRQSHNRWLASRKKQKDPATKKTARDLGFKMVAVMGPTGKVRMQKRYVAPRTPLEALDRA